jgi:2-(3-amino-3-carboxypropyl)histidine synthase
MVDSFFVEAKWTGDVSLGREVVDYVKKNKFKKVALFMSIQFLSDANLKLLKSQIQSISKDVIVLTSKAKRACSDCQVLGCDSYDDSYSDNILNDADVLMYIGDGKFHYTALLLSQLYSGLNKELLVWNPVSKLMTVYTTKEVLKIKGKLKGKMLKFMEAKNIGILVTIKQGQSFPDLADKLKKKLQKEKKNAYIFVDNTFDFAHLENYNFIDFWVNTACPRIGQDDETVSPILNVKEALDPEMYLRKLG